MSPLFAKDATDGAPSVATRSRLDRLSVEAPMNCRDVLIHAISPDRNSDFQDFPPVEKRTDLSEQIWIGPLTAGLLTAARISLDPSGNAENIYPAIRNGISTEIFLSPHRTRNWLTQQNVDLLQELVPRCSLPMPQRVHNAYWHHEYAARTYYMNHRWSFICTGLEALTHTDKWHSTRQFAKRVPALAAELEIPLSEDQAVEIYDTRSRLAHGLDLLAKGPGGPSPHLINA